MYIFLDFNLSFTYLFLQTCLNHFFLPCVVVELLLIYTHVPVNSHVHVGMRSSLYQTLERHMALSDSVCYNITAHVHIYVSLNS